MLPDRQRLERRREVLVGAILYVEEQCKTLSRDSADFVEWARHELEFVEKLLEYEALLEQIMIPLSAPAGMVAA